MINTSLRTRNLDKAHRPAAKPTDVLEEPSLDVVREADNTHVGRVVTELRGRPVPVGTNGTARHSRRKCIPE